MIWVIFAHYIGDWALQSTFMGQSKGKLWMVMLSHCMVWTACICVALQYCNLFAVWKVVFLVIGHWVVDLWKCRKPNTPENWKYIYPDQIWHLMQCTIVYYL